MVRFYQEDLVRSSNGTGVVIRCWHDDSSQIPHHEMSGHEDFPDFFREPLKTGQVGVAMFPSASNHGSNHIISESEAVLVDRSFHVGDYCKQQIQDMMSGVVLDLEVHAKLKHAISGVELEGFHNIEDLDPYTELDVGDYVIHDDWVGQVLEVFDEATIELSSGQLMRLPEFSSRLTVGEKGTDILPEGALGAFPKSALSFLTGSSRKEDTVLDVQHTVYAITWLAINQSLDPKATQARPRPRQFWLGPELSKLTIVRGKSDPVSRVGDKVLLKNSEDVPSTKHGRNEIESKTLSITETQTTALVLWQDGTREKIRTTLLMPYLNPDEHDAWPGDHVMVSTDEGQKRPAIIQSISDRTARVLFQDGTTDLVSVLEIDAHGSLLADPNLGIEFGVRRGDFVFIHPQGANGQAFPLVPRIGEVEAWPREVMQEDEVTGWRRQMIEIGSALCDAKGDNFGPSLQYRVKQPELGTPDFLWFGEVVELQLDGMVHVMHPGGMLGIYSVDKITRLHDGIEQLEMDNWDMQGDEHMDRMDEDDGMWDDEEMDSDTMVADSDWETDAYANTDVGMDAEDVALEVPQSNTALPAETPHPKPEHSRSKDVDWKQFDVQTSVPIDHAFRNTTPAQPSRSFLSRIQREYRAFITGLPDSIFVRAYEDRSDLLRSIIFGPENTPYEDAPFVIDWMLDGDFPNTPPIAHFHSWTEGKGRVNPNLYEEGKVCLSILGTWSGDHTESWSAARSSILQAVVSIQGLVLVKEPWFCEPAYEKFRGTEDGIVNSRLYNERAYILSRNFIKHALEVSIGGFHDELQSFYFERGTLAKVVTAARDLIERSGQVEEANGEPLDLAVPRLSSGGVISLTRTLKKLQYLSDAGRAS
ncbi:hypothetical protein BDV98DRAFT_559298 [Pterulicium gracile]|uniref:UBC core domain-containing protein n=1 Tax=Pterulicium gracile TaxID=1884261 RepID=A0A5C3QWG9_9AGAR|nr:hypothetical protein BDV98DRAFT_559298 [Pterula gracilis]